MTQHRARGAGLVLSIATFLFIAVATLRPGSAAAIGRSSACIVCGELGGVDIILNVLLFVPLGFGLRLAGTPWRKALILVVALTASVETLQATLVAGRDPTLGDVIANTLGGALGMLLRDHGRALLAPSAQQGRRLFGTGAAVWTAMMLAFAWAAAPAPPSTTFWLQWAHVLGGMDPFRGEVVSAAVRRTPLPDGRFPRSLDLRTQLLTEGAPVEAMIIPAGPTTRVAPIFAIFDGHFREVLLLAQDGRDLVFRVRLHASDARFRSPMLRLPEVFPARAPGAAGRMRIGASMAAGVLRVYAVSARDSAARSIALGPGLGWAMLVPWAYAFDESAPVLSALWLGALLLPLGFWARRASAWWVLPTLGIAVAAGLLLAPALAGEPAPGAVAWVGSVAGMVAGWTGGRRRAIRQRSDDRARDERLAAPSRSA